MGGCLVEDADHLQVVRLPDGVVIGVMRRGDLEGAGAEGAVHVFIRDHRDAPVEHGHQHFLADVFLIAFILRVHRHGGIAEDGFGAGGSHGDELAGQIRQHVFEIVQGSRVPRNIPLRGRRQPCAAPGDQLIRRGPR